MSTKLEQAYFFALERLKAKGYYIGVQWFTNNVLHRSIWVKGKRYEVVDYKLDTNEIPDNDKEDIITICKYLGGYYKC